MESLLNIRSREQFGEIVTASYGEGSIDYSAALMDWSTYNFLVQLNIAKEPITSMRYSVIYAMNGQQYLTGNNIPQDVMALPNRLPVAVKSCKIDTSQLGKYLDRKYMTHIWDSSYLVPTLVELGLVEKSYGVGVEVDIPYHPISNGKIGREEAFYFEY